MIIATKVCTSQGNKKPLWQLKHPTSNSTLATSWQANPQRPKQEKGPSKRKVSPAHTKDKAMQVTRKKFNFRYFNDFQMIKRLDQIKNDLFQSKI